MKIENLKVFLSVAHTGNIHRTAEIFFTSHPNISYIIKNIEKELGVVLFTRNNKGMTLTQDGERFLELVEPFLSNYNDFVLESISKNSTMVFQMFTTPTFEHYVKSIPDFIYSDYYYLSIIKRNTGEMIDMISNNQSGIYLFPYYKRIPKSILQHKESILLANDRSIYFCSCKNELLKENISKSELLKKIPLITNSYFQPHSGERMVLNIDDIDTCKKYMREKNFCYSGAEFIYKKSFTELDKWTVISRNEYDDLAYYLFLINLSEKQLEFAKQFFLPQLQQLFSICSKEQLIN